jgi:hypothetical protein
MNSANGIIDRVLDGHRFNKSLAAYILCTRNKRFIQRFSPEYTPTFREGNVKICIKDLGRGAIAGFRWIIEQSPVANYCDEGDDPCIP